MKAAATAAALVCIAAMFSEGSAQERRLGPKDGADLPAVDTGRVAVGSVAPDFALAALDGSVIALSDYRGRRNTILVFYRGFW